MLSEYEKWLKQIEKNLLSVLKIKDGAFALIKFDNGLFNHDSMVMIVMDAVDYLSGGVTTSCKAFKIHGRVDDSAIIGTSLFIDNDIAAAASSSVGE